MTNFSKQGTIGRTGTGMGPLKAHLLGYARLLRQRHCIRETVVTTTPLGGRVSTKTWGFLYSDDTFEAVTIRVNA